MSTYGNKIIELRKNGKTYKEICKELNCAFSTVSYHCKINNLGGYCDRLTENQKIELQQLYDEIGNLKKVAKIKGHAYGTVRKYVKIKKNDKTKTKSQLVIEWRRRTKIKLINYMGGKCQTCGYDKSINALHFHHKNPNEKKFQISGKSISFDKLKKEADKCILLCSNCHHELHDKNLN